MLQNVHQNKFLATQLLTVPTLWNTYVHLSSILEVFPCYFILLLLYVSEGKQLHFLLHIYMTAVVTFKNLIQHKTTDVKPINYNALLKIKQCLVSMQLMQPVF